MNALQYVSEEIARWITYANEIPIDHFVHDARDAGADAPDVFVRGLFERLTSAGLLELSAYNEPDGVDDRWVLTSKFHKTTLGMPDAEVANFIARAASESAP